MAKQSTIEKIYAKYIGKMSSLFTNADATMFLKGLADGSNKYMRVDRVGSSAFDSSWIDKIEDVIFDLGDIIANPRQNTKTVPELTPVELARKVNSESIRHLASHTQYIKDVSEGGDVIPSKLLNISHDDDLHTYENRFIATFVRKLLLFIEKRYEFITKFAPLKDEEVLLIKNRSNIDDSEIEIETKVHIKTIKNDNIGLKTTGYVQRIEQIREYVMYFMSTPFMKELKTDRDVRNPILQTNIIRKNIKYHHCYEVYRFIEKYTSLGVNYKVDESYSEFTPSELAELNYITFTNFLALRAKHMSEQHKTNTKTYKPRIGMSYDDEAFVYGPLTNGNVEFARIDEEYLRYLSSRVRKDMPIHMTKKEREYFSDEIVEKKIYQEEENQIEKLKRRKSKETERFDKLFEQFVQERKEEEDRVAKLIQDAVKQLQESYYNVSREDIIRQAKEDVLAFESVLKSREEQDSHLSNIELRDEDDESSIINDYLNDEAIKDISNNDNEDAMKEAEKEYIETPINNGIELKEEIPLENPIDSLENDEVEVCIDGDNEIAHSIEEEKEISINDSSFEQENVVDNDDINDSLFKQENVIKQDDVNNENNDDSKTNDEITMMSDIAISNGDIKIMDDTTVGEVSEAEYLNQNNDNIECDVDEENKEYLDLNAQIDNNEPEVELKEEIASNNSDEEKDILLTNIDINEEIEEYVLLTNRGYYIEFGKYTRNIDLAKKYRPGEEMDRVKKITKGEFKKVEL